MSKKIRDEERGSLLSLHKYIPLTKNETQYVHYTYIKCLPSNLWAYVIVYVFFAEKRQGSLFNVSYDLVPSFPLTFVESSIK